MKAPRAMMNVRQAAAYLGVSEDKLREYAKKKTVPAFKLGDSEGCSWRFSKTALDKWMEEMIERQTSRRKKKASAA